MAVDKATAYKTLILVVLAIWSCAEGVNKDTPALQCQVTNNQSWITCNCSVYGAVARCVVNGSFLHYAGYSSAYLYNFDTFYTTEGETHERVYLEEGDEVTCFLLEMGQRSNTTTCLKFGVMTESKSSCDRSEGPNSPAKPPTTTSTDSSQQLPNKAIVLISAVLVWVLTS